MASAREMRLRIRSVKNIAQVTRALQAVSASKVRKAMAAVLASRPYAEKAWKLLLHLARQPGRDALNPLMNGHGENIRSVLVLMLSGDRGLAGAYNTNILRFTLLQFRNSPVPVEYVAVGRKGRDLLFRRKQRVIGEFSDLSSPPSFVHISPIARILIDHFLSGKADEVYLVYTRFVNMVTQVPTIQKLLPLEVPDEELGKYNQASYNPLHSVFTYEPDSMEILDQIIRRFVGLQVYQAVLESQASEHAARMIAMQNATDNAKELQEVLQLDYNKVRQQNITSDILDIASGANALMQAAVVEE